MAEFAKIMEIRNRMCSKLKSCADCPISHMNTGLKFTCRELVHKDPKRYEDILLKWDAENPVKTNKDKFKEVFGLEIYGCNGFECPDSQACDTCEFQNFWEQEYKEKTNGRND